MITVSVLIPTYKRPGLVVEAIRSCLDQTYPPYEVVVGDDSPDDLTQQAIAKLQQETAVPIRYLHNQPALRQAENTNLLFSSAKGDKSVLLHDDDLLLPEALATLVQCFEEHPEINVAYGKQYIISDEGTINYESSVSCNVDYYRSPAYAGSVLTPLGAGIGQLPNNGYMIDTEIIRQIQFRTFDEVQGPIGNGCEYDFGVRIGLAGCRAYFVDKYLTKYRLSATSMSKSKTDDAAYKAFMILKDVPADTEQTRQIKEQRLREKAPIAITQAVDVGQKKDAWAIYRSEWYGKKAISLGGLKRIAYIMFK